jgi:hypothetical protein
VIYVVERLNPKKMEVHLLDVPSPQSYAASVAAKSGVREAVVP